MNKFYLPPTCLLVVSLLTSPSVLYAQKIATSEREVFAEFAGLLSKVLEGEGETGISVGTITGPGNISATSGPGYAKILKEELIREKIMIEEGMKFGITGEYKAAEIPASHPDDARIGKKVVGIRIILKVEDTFGNPLGNINFNRLIRGEQTVAPALGLTLPLVPEETELERDREIRRKLVKPSFFTKGNVLRSEQRSPFGIELQVNKKGRRPQNIKGKAFLPLTRNDVYTVKIVNDAEFDVAVTLKIDGLSMFTFSELRQPKQLPDGKPNPAAGEPRFGCVIVKRKSSAVIPGWHIDNEQSDQFVITSYARSAAAALNHHQDIGLITATFQAAWEGDDAPKDEPGRRRGGDGDVTGRGQRIDQPYKVVQQNLGVIRDVISVRYSKKNAE